MTMVARLASDIPGRPGVTCFHIPNMYNDGQSFTDEEYSQLLCNLMVDYQNEERLITTDGRVTDCSRGLEFISDHPHAEGILLRLQREGFIPRSTRIGVKYNVEEAQKHPLALDLSYVESVKATAEKVATERAVRRAARRWKQQARVAQAPPLSPIAEVAEDVKPQPAEAAPDEVVPEIDDLVSADEQLRIFKETLVEKGESADALGIKLHAVAIEVGEMLDGDAVRPADAKPMGDAEQAPLLDEFPTAPTASAALGEEAFDEWVAIQTVGDVPLAEAQPDEEPAIDGEALQTLVDDIPSAPSVGELDRSGTVMVEREIWDAFPDAGSSELAHKTPEVSPELQRILDAVRLRAARKQEKPHREAMLADGTTKKGDDQEASAQKSSGESTPKAGAPVPPASSLGVGRSEEARQGKSYGDSPEHDTAPVEAPKAEILDMEALNARLESLRAPISPSVPNPNEEPPVRGSGEEIEQHGEVLVIEVSSDALARARIDILATIDDSFHDVRFVSTEAHIRRSLEAYILEHVKGIPHYRMGIYSPEALPTHDIDFKDLPIHVHGDHATVLITDFNVEALVEKSIAQLASCSPAPTQISMMCASEDTRLCVEQYLSNHPDNSRGMSITLTAPDRIPFEGVHTLRVSARPELATPEQSEQWLRDLEINVRYARLGGGLYQLDFVSKEDQAFFDTLAVKPASLKFSNNFIDDATPTFNVPPYPGGDVKTWLKDAERYAMLYRLDAEIGSPFALSFERIEDVQRFLSSDAVPELLRDAKLCITQPYYSAANLTEKLIHTQWEGLSDFERTRLFITPENRHALRHQMNALQMKDSVAFGEVMVRTPEDEGSLAFAQQAALVKEGQLNGRLLIDTYQAPEAGAPISMELPEHQIDMDNKRVTVDCVLKEGQTPEECRASLLEDLRFIRSQEAFNDYAIVVNADWESLTVVKKLIKQAEHSALVNNVSINELLSVDVFHGVKVNNEGVAVIEVAWPTVKWGKTLTEDEQRLLQFLTHQVKGQVSAILEQLSAAGDAGVEHEGKSFKQLEVHSYGDVPEKIFDMLDDHPAFSEDVLDLDEEALAALRAAQQAALSPTHGVLEEIPSAPTPELKRPGRTEKMYDQEKGHKAEGRLSIVDDNVEDIEDDLKKVFPGFDVIVSKEGRTLDINIIKGQEKYEVTYAEEVPGQPSIAISSMSNDERKVMDVLIKNIKALQKPDLDGVFRITFRRSNYCMRSEQALKNAIEQCREAGIVVVGVTQDAKSPHPSALSMEDATTCVDSYWRELNAPPEAPPSSMPFMESYRADTDPDGEALSMMG